MRYPTICHPSRYIWDFWYFYDASTATFHVFFLNADSALVADDQHHHASQVGYGVTQDFITMEWQSENVLSADPSSWDNTSIWTGDVIRIRDGFLMFYTSRDRNHSDGLTQNIGVAFTDRIDADWEKIPHVRIAPDPTFYEPNTVVADLSIHAWRDPFLFVDRGVAYMLVAAKSVGHPIGGNAAIGLLRARNRQLSDWEALPPLYSPDFYSEMEVPQLYFDSNGAYRLVYSNHAKWDNAPTTQHQGGLHQVQSPSLFSLGERLPDVVLAQREGLYACRIIPELGGDVVGFNVRTGGLQRCGLKTGMSHVNRNFSEFSLPL